MSQERSGRKHVAQQDIPLPGHYGVLTTQLNVTRYHRTNTVRWVLVVREPSEQVEVHRTFGELADDSQATDRAIVAAVLDAITVMLYMQTGIERREEASPPN